MFAFVRADPDATSTAAEGAPLVLPDLRATPSTTATTIDGRALRVDTAGGGMQVWLDEPVDTDVPIAVAVHHAEATERP